MKPTTLTPYIIALVVFLVFLVLFAIGSTLAIIRIRRRRAPTLDEETLPTILASYAPKGSNPTPTVSALVAQSIILATAPIRLGVMPTNVGPKTADRLSMDFACCGIPRSESWGKTTVGLFGLTVSSSVSSFDSATYTRYHAGSDTMSDSDMDDLEAGRPSLTYGTDSSSDSDSDSMPPTPTITLCFPSSDIVFNVLPKQDQGLLYVEEYKEEEEEEEEGTPVAVVQSDVPRRSLAANIDTIHPNPAPRIAAASLGMITEEEEEE